MSMKDSLAGWESPRRRPLQPDPNGPRSSPPIAPKGPQSIAPKEAPRRLQGLRDLPRRRLLSAL